MKVQAGETVHFTGVMVNGRPVVLSPVCRYVGYYYECKTVSHLVSEICCDLRSESDVLDELLVSDANLFHDHDLSLDELEELPNKQHFEACFYETSDGYLEFRLFHADDVGGRDEG